MKLQKSHFLKMVMLSFFIFIPLLNGCDLSVEKPTNYPKQNFNFDNETEKPAPVKASSNDLEQKKEEMNAAFINVYKKTKYTKGENDAYYIFGKTSNNCSKITVEAKNETAGINDSYVLKKYKLGDTTFKYGVREDWDNLGVGKNVYTFAAHCEGDQIKNDFAIFNYEKPVSKPITKTVPKIIPPPPPVQSQSCDPNYSGCVPIASDVDCAGGSGNGPAYVQGPVRVIGSDIYGLDRDKDGYGCE
ncbi:hypothetical protein GF340_05055 [Candidatus Peregrinibacteria bacterium]|nr:hypothetical protein [Candidatus Peregrinibacteria bacterium]